MTLLNKLICLLSGHKIILGKKIGIVTTECHCERCGGLFLHNSEYDGIIPDNNPDFKKTLTKIIKGV